MKRLLGSPWKHIALQLGLLGGIAAAFVITTREEPPRWVDDESTCPSENECTFKKPNIMLLMDYSTSMHNIWDNQNNLTRWQVVVNSIKTITQDGSYLSQNTHLAMMRFGHDPTPTRSPERSKPRPKSDSGPLLADRSSPDLPWYDAQNDPWYECNGAAIGAALDAAGDPINGSLVGIGTWSKGALDYTKTLTEDSDVGPPGVTGERVYLNVVTDAAWTGIEETSSPDAHATAQQLVPTGTPCLRLVERPPSWSSDPSVVQGRGTPPLDVASGDVPPPSHASPPHASPPSRVSPPVRSMPHRSLDPRLRFAA